MAMRQMQAQPAAKPAKQPGAMIQRAQRLAVGGGAPRPVPSKPLPTAGPPGGIGSEPEGDEAPTVNLAGHAPVFNTPGQQLGTPGAMDPGTAEGIRRMGGTPPIFAGGQQPGQPPGGGLQVMDGSPGIFVPPGGPPGAPGAPGPGDIPPGMGPDMRPTGQHPLNPAAGAGGMPPGMQLPPQLQQAVQAGRLDPQQAFDRAMQNRAGFRQQVMQQQAQQPQMQRGIRNLSDVFRGGSFSAAPGQMPLNTKPLPANGAGGVAQQGPLAGGGGVSRGPFRY